MYAISKTPVSPESAQRIAAAHFGAAAKISHYTELPDGMYNSAYRIDLADGQRAVLKVAPPDQVRVLQYEKNIMAAEVDVLRLVAARTGVPVPGVFAYDTSRQLIDNDFYLMAFVPGLALNKLRPQLSAADQRGIDLCTGEYLREINAITGPAFGYFAQPELHFASWREAFGDMVERVLEDGRTARVDPGMPYEMLEALLQRFYPLLDEVARPALVHWDLWDGNIFVDPKTLCITGILDCERALWGDPLMEVNFGAFGWNSAFLEGYGVDLLATPGASVRRTLYNIYLWLIMVIEPTYRRYETKDQENWARGKLLEDVKKLESFDD